MPYPFLALICMMHTPAAPEIDVPVVYAVIETEPVSSTGDAADDPAIWVHPTDPALSLIIGTDKQAGLVVYDTAGRLLQSLPTGRPNNVDLRCAARLGDTLDLVAASDRADNSIALYRIDAASRTLAPLTRIPTGLTEVYGICLSLAAERTPTVFINDKDGRIEQWALSVGAEGTITGEPVRRFKVNSQPEGMVADDDLGALFVGEEDVGIWMFSTDAASTEPPVQIDHAGPGGHLAADVEGLTIYPAGQAGGYLIASSQGDNSFAVYERSGDHRWLFSFRVGDGAIDGAEDTDGIDVTPSCLGPGLPFGALVVQDGRNPGGTQNFKIVPWESVARLPQRPLHIDTTREPRTAER